MAIGECISKLVKWVHCFIRFCSGLELLLSSTLFSSDGLRYFSIFYLKSSMSIHQLTSYQDQS
jgi:hypothetical protein